MHTETHPKWDGKSCISRNQIFLSDLALEQAVNKLFGQNLIFFDWFIPHFKASRLIFLQVHYSIRYLLYCERCAKTPF